MNAQRNKKNAARRVNRRRRRNNNRNGIVVAPNNNNGQRQQIIKQPKPQIIYIKDKPKEKSLFDSLGGLITKGLTTLISGFGDYKVQGNSLMTGGMSPPAIVNSVDNGGFIIRHREYLADIGASSPFSLNTYTINPGDPNTFPWLSTIAVNFEQYRVRGMLFEFKSLSSDAVLSASTSSALGSIIMATQYDVLDYPFINKFEMENYQYANSSKPSLSFIHPIECARAQTSVSELYVRSGQHILNNSDARFYDLGKFNIASVGMQATSGVAGELWCSYEIELFKPKIGDVSTTYGLYDHFTLAGASDSAPIGTSSVRSVTSTLRGTINSAGTVYTFDSSTPHGNYLIQLTMTGGSVTIGGTSTTFSACLGLNRYSSNSVSFINASGASATTYLYTQYITVTGSPATITFASGTFPSSPVGDLYILQVPTNLV